MRYSNGINYRKMGHNNEENEKEKQLKKKEKGNNW